MFSKRLFKSLENCKHILKLHKFFWAGENRWGYHIFFKPYTLNPENSENRIWVLWENLSGSLSLSLYIYIYIHIWISHVRTWGRFSVQFSQSKVSIGSHFENRVENRVSIWEPPNTGAYIYWYFLILKKNFALDYY
jgi:hypothetical protein